MIVFELCAFLPVVMEIVFIVKHIQQRAAYITREHVGGSAMVHVVVVAAAAGIACVCVCVVVMVLVRHCCCGNRVKERKTNKLGSFCVHYCCYCTGDFEIFSLVILKMEDRIHDYFWTTLKRTRANNR